MPKYQKPKSTVSHRMVLRRRGSAQPVVSAGPAQIAAASSNANNLGTGNPPFNHEIHPPSSLPTLSNNPRSAPSTPLPAFATTALDNQEKDLVDTQILDAGNGFSEAAIANLANVGAVPSIPVDPPIPIVSRLRRGFAQLSNLDPGSPTDEESATQEATQLVAATTFSACAINGLSNAQRSVATEEALETQVVIAQARFPEAALRQLGNVGHVRATASGAGTQVVASRAQFSERIAAELGNVDLVNIAIAPTPAIEDGDWDEGTTIKDFSQVPKFDTPLSIELEQALSKRTTIKSWASGSLTTSMRELVGLPPKPLRNGKLRPVLEDLGLPPARWPCQITAMHPTCGHTYRTVVHSHLCYYFEEKPGQRTYREPTPEQQILDEWGLPPSAQQPRTQGSSGSRTQVITENGEECYESTSSMRLTGTLCDTCRAEQGERK